MSSQSHPHRNERITEALHHAVAEALQREVHLPKAMITITGVEVSRDGQYADVRFSVIPTTRWDDAMELLEKTVWFVQQRVNAALPIRPVPKIRFVADHAGEKVSRIDEIARTVENTPSSPAPRTPVRRTSATPAKSHASSRTPSRYTVGKSRGV